jgi:hypothetical protein
MKHTCHWPDCTQEVPPRLFMCRRHWFTLPLALRREIWRTYRPGQKVTKDPSPEGEGSVTYRGIAVSFLVRLGVVPVHLL